MEQITSTASLREYIHDRKSSGQSIAFVPTMGALHKGHRSCLDVARPLGDVLVVSIFVNPTQFGPNEDYRAYPRPLDEDVAKCEAWGCDVVFAPATEDMYPVPQTVWIDVGGLSEPLCGRTRAGHFRGVATVVHKLFNIVEPDVAVFGQKDAQQALVIREMTRQMNLPVRIELSPVVREDDGLAVSSRNAYLSVADRAIAPGLRQGLRAGIEALEAGERSADRVCAAARSAMEAAGMRDVEYVELLDAATLETRGVAAGRMLLAAAVKLGKTRLIDNIVVDITVHAGVRETALF